MSDLFAVPAVVLAGYLAGSIPAGYLLVRACLGFDIRTRGSGNIGATNVYRVAGARLAGVTFLCDTVKGMLPVWLAASLDLPGTAALLGGAAAVIGHSFPVFLRGRGGKGVATTFGVALALMPGAALLALAAWLAVVMATRHVSVASLVAAAVFGPLTWCFFPGDRWRLGFGVAAGLLIIAAHRANIVRLRAGTEPRMRLPWARM